MRRFFGVPITRWASPRDRLHVYALPGARLVDRLTLLQKALDGIDYCSTQPPEHLHATVQQFAFSTAEVPPAELAGFAAGLARLAGETPPFAVPLGPPVVDDHSIGVRGHATRRWVGLSAAIRELAAATFHGGVALPPAPRKPHLTLGYGLGDGSSAVLQDRVDALHTGLLPDLRVDRIHLLGVHQDEERGVYTWDPLGSWELA